MKSKSRYAVMVCVTTVVGLVVAGCGPKAGTRSPAPEKVGTENKQPSATAPSKATDDNEGRQFSAKNLQQTQSWADSVKSNLLAVSEQGNAIVYKEAKESAEKIIAALIGQSVSWTFHVASVEENGTVKLKEAFDTDSFSFSFSSSLRILFSQPPSFAPERLRALRAGDAVAITATIKKAGLLTGGRASDGEGIFLDLDGVRAP